MNNEQEATEGKEAADHMSKIEAVGILLRLAYKRTTTRDEVIAIQVACRSTLKRFFDRERNWKRRHEAEIAAETSPQDAPQGGEYVTPPEALALVAGARPLDAIFQNPPFEVTPSGEAEDNTNTEQATSKE